MVGKEQIAIDRKITLDELNSFIKHENNSRVLKRLYFVKFRYLGDSVEEATNKVGVTKKTGYYWQEDWNQGGYSALIPEFGGGRKSKLTDKQKNELRTLLEAKDYWTTREVLKLIKEKYNVDYSLKQIGVILHSFNMYYSKPYTLDFRRPENAEEILKKLSEAIPEDIGPDEQYIIGFLDESSPQTKANTQRLWSFKRPFMIKNTDYIKANAFAFYSINGKNLIDFKDCSKAECVCEFLGRIVEQNKNKQIILILDNSKAHHAKKTIERARKLGIILVFLPTYSPDLNPVEFIWKTIKREVSAKFVESKDHLRNIIKDEFMKVENSLSFAKGWIEKFHPLIKSVIY
ncbi:MAG: IS630 family transposase [Methanosarcinaceae archaeon]|nr:IS630 family transposase [Methanosarcinaceae archaeon]